MALAAAGAALGLGATPGEGIAAGLAGAGLAGAIRTLAGDSAAALVGAAIAPLLAVISILEHGGVLGHGAAFVALAAIGWTCAELAKPTRSPVVAMLPATVAAILEPAAAALIPLAGWRLVIAPWQRPRWILAVPIAGAIACALAIAAGLARSGSLASLGAAWYGGAPRPVAPAAMLGSIGDGLGPLTAVAAIAGLAGILRLRLAELALLSCAAGALLVDLRAGTSGPTTFGIAAVAAGLAIVRFAGAIRIPSGQAVVGATAGALLLAPPAWTAIEREQRVSIHHASR